MLLHILSRTGQHPHDQELSISNVNSGRLRNSDLKGRKIQCLKKEKEKEKYSVYLVTH